MSGDSALAGTPLENLTTPQPCLAVNDFPLNQAPSLCGNIAGTVFSISPGGQSSSPRIVGAGGSSPLSFQEVLESMPDYKASLAAWQYGPPFLLLLGTVGNVMTLWVLSASSPSSSSSSSSSSMTVYFRALAVSDLTLLYTGLLRNWARYTFHFDIRATHSAVCKLHMFLVYLTGMTSAWFLVMMTAQRALAVVWPHRTELFGSRRAAAITVAVIVSGCCLLNAHILYGVGLVACPLCGAQRYRCDSLDPDYDRFVSLSWPWIDTSLSCLLPFGSLLVSNSLLMWKVASSIRDVKKLTSVTGRPSSSQDAVAQRQKMSTSLNVTLIFLSTTFFLLTSPIYVYQILEYCFQLIYYDFQPDSQGRVTTESVENTAAAYLGWAGTNLMWYTNSAVNFYLYCLSGSRFRSQVRQCLCGSCGVRSR